MSKTDRTKFTAYITKYALTTGIEEVEAEDCFHISKVMISARKNQYTVCYYGNDWHRTMDEALGRSEEMRLTKIASHRKSIARLEKLQFHGATS